jgi:uncharacterized membrane protein YgdD (TMEM256/DUF423 family)
MMKNIFITLGSINAAISVMMGAFGAHKLKNFLITTQRVDVFEKATSYQMYHAIAMLIVGISMMILKTENKFFVYSGWSFMIGILFFCGSLYAICITQITKLGMIAPIGGTAFIIGWVLLLYAHLTS